MERSGWPGSSGNAARSVELEPPGEGLYLGWAGRREGIPGRCTEARSVGHVKGAVKKQAGVGSHRKESWWAEGPKGQGQRPGRHRALLRGLARLRANCRGHSAFLLDPIAILSRSEAQVAKPMWHRVRRQSSRPAWPHTLPLRCVTPDKLPYGSGQERHLHQRWQEDSGSRFP